jgi:phosphatidylglycerol:prolipoprotein diacylglycerol transferase
MRQVLFHDPFFGFPIYGFGVMLFITFLATTWTASRRAKQEGVAPEILQDMAMWVFIGRIIGARIVYMIQYGRPISEFFKIWEGGLVFYGSAIGGFAGYGLYYLLVIRKLGLSSWKLADIVAPTVAVGLFFGRIGCLLNGCCYGNVACAHCPAIHFFLSSPARHTLVESGYQTAAGFTVKEVSGPAVVGAVAHDSAAEANDLRPGDEIVAADDRVITSFKDLNDYLALQWPRGKNDLTLTVRRQGKEITLSPFVPRTLGLHPTQIYESISMVFLFLLLTAFYPFRRHDGEVMVLFMLGYAIHRFLNEMLRNDTDPVAFGMTLSQNGSILFFAAGLLMLAWIWRKPVQNTLSPNDSQIALASRGR